MNKIIQLHRLSTYFDAQIQEWGGSLFSLAIRIFVSWQFFKAGLLKLQDWELTLSLFREEYTVPFLPPEFAAAMGAGGEVLFPILIVLGIFSRPAALGLFCVNAMAVISYPQLWTFECPAAINDHLYWGLLLSALFFYGPGRFSFDYFLKKRWTK
ncbi:DoxX family protein [Undibacterium sp. LX40W]|uniref:DoxX family protein n=1 Tax=Undibacterium nitidum TaxID=2762298 RepID=A0A923HQC3_9BURK|nr:MULTISPECIES: DoxX family protein [Undibacterium]MBC3880537.1 DoxX family protein [Undibacterium nitidum]MBC3890727.1 DoxX family protein [Undibacterium sp. LX40W]